MPGHGDVVVTTDPGTPDTTATVQLKLHGHTSGIMDFSPTMKPRLATGSSP